MYRVAAASSARATDLRARASELEKGQGHEIPGMARDIRICGEEV